MAASKDKHVFISIGGRYNSEQEAFLDALLKLLESYNVTPRVMNRTRRDYPVGSPLAGIANVLRECNGAIIVAFEKKFFPAGVEYPSSAKSMPLHNTRYTTPWNQIEAAMAFALGIPIIVLAENGLHEEGLLEQKYDWYVQHISMNVTSLENVEVRQRLQLWCDGLKEKSGNLLVRPDPENWTIGDLLRGLKFPTALKILAIVASVFGSGVAVGKWFQTIPVTSSATHR